MVWRKSPRSLVDLFDSVLPRGPRIERRKMFGYPAAFLNGRLFAGLHQQNFILKLSPEDRATLMAERNARLFEPIPGRPMREYIALPKALLSERRALAAWLRRSIAYVGAMPAKPARHGRSKKTTGSREANSRRK